MRYRFDEDIEFSQGRLHGSLIRNEEDKVVRVQTLHRDKNVDWYDPLSGDEGETPLGLCDLTPFKLGGVNTEQASAYLMRAPRRQWKHGVRAATTVKMWYTNRFRLDDIMVAMCYNMKWDPFLEYLEELVNGSYGGRVAISRDFNIILTKNMTTLHYKDVYAGDIDDNGEVNLLPEKLYLSELLKEQVI